MEMKMDFLMKRSVERNRFTAFLYRAAVSMIIGEEGSVLLRREGMNRNRRCIGNASIRRLRGRIGGRKQTRWSSNTVRGIGIPYRSKSKAYSANSSQMFFLQNNPRGHKIRA